MDKAIWETLKCTRVIKQCEFEEQNEEQESNEEVFNTPPKSLPQIVITK
jgi:hypothetical protein